VFCVTCTVVKLPDYGLFEYDAMYRVTKKRELLKNPTKIEEIQEKKFIDRY